MNAKRSTHSLMFIVVLLVLPISVGKATANSINIFGLNHTSTGSAAIGKSDNVLSVTHIGPVGPPGSIPRDGVRVDLPPNVVRWEAELLGGDIHNTPVGATFTQTSRGVVGGVPNQTISVMELIHTFGDPRGDEIRFTSRFPFAENLPGASLTAQYSNAGRVVMTHTEIDLRHASWRSSQFHLPRFDIDREIPPKAGEGLSSFSGTVSIRWPFAAPLFGPFEASPLTDFLLLTLDPGHDIGALDYTDVSLTAAGFSSFAISNETVEVVPEPTTLLLFGTTAAGLGLARWRRRRQS
jgi:hypothetical protein